MRTNCSNQFPMNDFAFALEQILGGNKVCHRAGHSDELVYAATVDADAEYVPALLCYKSGSESIYVPQPHDFTVTEWEAIAPPVDVAPGEIDIRGSYQSFSYALRKMRDGAIVKRDSWDAQIVKLDTILLDEGGQTPTPKALIIRDNALTPWRLWTPTFADLFAKDWRVHAD